MQRLVLITLLGVFFAAPAYAQQNPAPGGPAQGPPPPGMQQHMEQLREGARAQAMTALSVNHQAKIQALLARIKAGQITDVRAAAQRIDGILTPQESQAVLAARDKMQADIRSAMQESGAPGGGQGAAGPGGPDTGQGGPPPDAGQGGPPDAGQGGPPPDAGQGGPPPDAGQGGPPPDAGAGQGGPPPDGGAGPGGPGAGPGGAPGGWRRIRSALRNDPGFALLTLNLNRQQMRSLFVSSGAPPPQR